MGAGVGGGLRGLGAGCGVLRDGGAVALSGRPALALVRAGVGWWLPGGAAWGRGTGVQLSRSLLLRLLLPEAASTLYPHTPGSQGPGGALFPFSRIPWFTYLHGIQSNTLVFKGIGDSLNPHQGNGYDEPSTNTPSPHKQNPPIHVPEEHQYRISLFVPEERTLWNGRRLIP